MDIGDIEKVWDVEPIDIEIAEPVPDPEEEEVAVEDLELSEEPVETL